MRICSLDLKSIEFNDLHISTDKPEYATHTITDNFKGMCVL